MNSIKRHKDVTSEDDLPQSYWTLKVFNRLPWKSRRQLVTNSCRKDEVSGPKQKWCSVVDVSGGESKVWCRKEQYCIATWIIRSMNQDKVNIVKQDMARVDISILGISELKWTGMGEFLIQMTIISTTVGKNPKERQCQRMFKLLHNCTHLTRQQSNAQSSPS